MKQSLKKEKLVGKDGFDSYYGELFGSRWEPLKKALLGDVRYVELALGGTKSYFLDPASVCAALCLDTSAQGEPGDGGFCIADLCAAPGGKTLVIASCMDKGCELYSNERSPARKKRLDLVVQETLCEELSCRLHTSCSDASLWGSRAKKAMPALPESFDAIFLDAPCSSERHVLSDKKYLDIWSPARIKGLAQEQWALLSSAWRILKAGGSLVYATCALNPMENDGVVMRLKKKFPDAQFLSAEQVGKAFARNLDRLLPGVKVGDLGFSLQEVFSFAERTELGFHILPDTASGCGPLYFCCIKKLGF
ncbi:MAG: RsmB/NOP family class I SAM-dependent RNA methyltransferase [Treponema sp.]|nr:RsmB/NOP family class I SAM-dependent RNA methyltransferase [Treponema sp.]MBP5748522.1 RsmB/NOP family class I SAM-dependent RNA methyltransferase [Treponema sp.]